MVHIAVTMNRTKRSLTKSDNIRAGALTNMFWFNNGCCPFLLIYNVCCRLSTYISLWCSTNLGSVHGINNTTTKMSNKLHAAAGRARYTAVANILEITSDLIKIHIHQFCLPLSQFLYFDIFSWA